jgi:hypothetical protein
VICDLAQREKEREKAREVVQKRTYISTSKGGGGRRKFVQDLYKSKSVYKRGMICTSNLFKYKGFFGT